MISGLTPPSYAIPPRRGFRTYLSSPQCPLVAYNSRSAGAAKPGILSDAIWWRRLCRLECLVHGETLRGGTAPALTYVIEDRGKATGRWKHTQGRVSAGRIANPSPAEFAPGMPDGAAFSRRLSAGSVTSGGSAPAARGVLDTIAHSFGTVPRGFTVRRGPSAVASLALFEGQLAVIAVTPFGSLIVKIFVIKELRLTNGICQAAARSANAVKRRQSISMRGSDRFCFTLRPRHTSLLLTTPPPHDRS